MKAGPLLGRRMVASVPQDSVATDFHATTPWTITVPLWVPGFKGQFVIGDVEMEGEPEDGEPGSGIFKKLFGSSIGIDYFFVGRVRYNYDTWYGEIDSYGGQVGGSVAFKALEHEIVSGSMRAILSRAVAGYLLRANANHGRGVRVVRFYMGVRWTATRVRAAFRNSVVSVDRTISWFDPLLGTEVPISLGRKWLVRFRADLGGFGINSRFVWSLAADVHFRPSLLIDLAAGWNVINVYFRGEVKEEKVTLDYLLVGPQVSLGFRL